MAKKSVAKRLTFAPYAIDEIRDARIQSAVAFAMLRKATLEVKEKADSPELASSWKLVGEVGMLIASMEIVRRVEVGVGPTGPVYQPIVILDPNGASVVTTDAHVEMLLALWKQWLKENSAKGGALRVHLTNEWLTTGITDADDESAIASSAVATGVAQVAAS